MVLMAKYFDQWKKNTASWLSRLQISLSAQVNGGPNANIGRGKEPISAVSVSWGFPGNDFAQMCNIR